MQIPDTLRALAVPIDDIHPYPSNPRRGDLEQIKTSLQANGQYRPIVANRRDGSVLAGNHTWKAAKALGWDQIAVTWAAVFHEFVDAVFSDLPEGARGDRQLPGLFAVEAVQPHTGVAAATRIRTGRWD